MKAIILALLMAATQAQAATAYWTGAQRLITTITGAPGVACEYNYAGRTFWAQFPGFSCPLSIEV